MVGSLGDPHPSGRSEVGVEGEDLVLLGLLDVGLLVLADSLLEEVGLAGEGDHVHPLEGVLDQVVLGHSECVEQAVCHEHDVLAHELGVHADELDGEGLSHELELDGDGVGDDLDDPLVGDLVVEVLVEQAGEVGVHALVSGDQLVGEGQAGHEAALLQPEDRAEGAREEDALHGGEGNKALGEGAGVVDPAESPIGLLGDHGDVGHGLEEELLLLGVGDEGVDQEGVGLGVDVLHHHLEAVEAAGLGHLDLSAELLGEVLVDDAVGGSKEGEHVLDEVPLGVVESLPVLDVGGEVDLLGGPESSDLLLVHLPDVAVPDGQDHEAVGVVLKQGLGQRTLSLGEVGVLRSLNGVLNLDSLKRDGEQMNMEISVVILTTP